MTVPTLIHKTGHNDIKITDSKDIAFYCLNLADKETERLLSPVPSLS